PLSLHDALPISFRCRPPRPGRRPPARVLDRARDDVLEPAEDGAAAAGRLVGAKAVLRVDVVPAPDARLAIRRTDRGSAVEARGGDLSQPYADTQGRVRPAAGTAL